MISVENIYPLSQSDVEARITALKDQLQLRIKTAARLKKEQRRDKREKLRSQVC